MNQRLSVAYPPTEVAIPHKRHRLFRMLLSEMRPHQWIKNSFVLAPLIFSGSLADLSAVRNSVAAFVVYCCLASSLYIFNDWIDAEEDRAHPVKRFRPISSGDLPLGIALPSAGILTLIGFLIAAMIGWNFFLIAALYFVLTLSYCLVLKQKMLIDCMTIAVGFVLRVVGGAIAINVVPTHWLIVCTFLLALFLAFTKRRQELLTLSEKAVSHREVLGKYSVEYLDQINTILIGATIVCYALYTVAPATVDRFGTDGLIYGTVFVIYGMFRYLALINNPENGGNPALMSVKDKPLFLTIIGWGVYNVLVIYHSNILGLWDRL